MSMSLDEQKKLDWILSKASASSALSPWEAGFISDMRRRFERFGEATKISPKQWAVVDKICEKAV